MIKNITIKDFKCFDCAEIALKKLNIFAGANSSGKSSALLALRLFADNLQTTDAQLRPHPISSQDHRIGRFSELRNFITNAKRFSIAADINGLKQTLDFTFADEGLNGTLVEQNVACSESLRYYYLSAARQSSLDIYGYNLNPSNPLGDNAEYLIDYYFRQKHELARRQIITNPATIHTIEGQANFWLRRLTGYEIQVGATGSNYIVLFKSANGKLLRPYHVGTGISFIASLIIACLLASDNDLVIVENPELHLHPKAQAEIMDFFAVIAASGVQLIIETHSDHIFNGIRRLIATKHVPVENASVTFFRTNDALLSQPCDIALTATGRMTKYEKGLFDQFDEDIDAILYAAQ